MTGARMASSGAAGAEVLRLLQLTVHTLLLQWGLRAVGQRGGKPEQILVGAREGVAEELVGEGGVGEAIGWGEAEAVGARGETDGEDERDDEADEIRVRFHCPLQAVPL